MSRPVWVDIDLDALFLNFEKIREVVGKNVKITAVLKQFAYGHGLIPVARKLYKAGIDSFGVGSIDEAIVLREDGYRGKIIFLSTVSKSLASYFVRYGITPILVDENFALELNNQAQKVNKIIPAHIKVDTGMGRLGFYPEQIPSFLERIKELKNIFLEGICTHLPVADTDLNFTSNQLSAFRRLIDHLKKEGLNFKYCHCANSLGIVKYPNSYFNMVRPGLILYGVRPIRNLPGEFKPVLSLKSRIIFIKEVPSGKTVGYGADFTAASKTKIATVSVGYADGYPWALSNKAKVLIKGKLFNIAGRVCMDHIMVDLGSAEDIQVEDTVTLIGRDQDKEITVEDLASWAGTIPYEIVTCIGRNLPRYYQDSKKSAHQA